MTREMLVKVHEALPMSVMPASPWGAPPFLSEENFATIVPIKENKKVRFCVFFCGVHRAVASVTVTWEDWLLEGPAGHQDTCACPWPTEGKEATSRTTTQEVSDEPVPRKNEQIPIRFCMFFSS